MKIEWLGVGGAFTTNEYYHSNFLIHARNDKKLLVDCGTDIRFSLTDAGYKPEDIDAVYISHLHSDHCMGLKWLGYMLFNQERKPYLYISEVLLGDLWQKLRSDMQFHEGRTLTLEDFFDVYEVETDLMTFAWEGIWFDLVKTEHIHNGIFPIYSYGLKIKEEKNYKSVVDTKNILFTSDSKILSKNGLPYSPHYVCADIIFHDCETADYHSKVHAHYDELRLLPNHIKNKMFLYHHNPNPMQDALGDGFQGFVYKGQIIDPEEVCLL